MKCSQKTIKNQTRQKFLQTFFDNKEPYGVQEVNGFILVKHPNGNTGGSEVAIFTKEAYKKHFDYQKRIGTAFPEAMPIEK